MKKLLSALFVCLFLMGTVITNVNAQEPLDVSVFGTHECDDCNEIHNNETRAIEYLCPYCSSSNTSNVKNYGSWTSTGTTRTCSHYNYGIDVYQSRTCSSTITCRDCGTVRTTKLPNETRWYCRGYN